MKAVLLTFAALGLLASAACGGSDDTSALKAQVGSLQTQVAPTVAQSNLTRPDGTDTKAAALESAFTDVQNASTAAVLVYVSLATLDDYGFNASKNDTTLRAWDTVRVQCALLQTISDSDLWPLPYSEFITSTEVACMFVDDYVKTPTPSMWQTTAGLLHSPFIPRLRLLWHTIPDYSEAQLRSAIAERQ